jgi:hypothetical protein
VAPPLEAEAPARRHGTNEQSWTLEDPVKGPGQRPHRVAGGDAVDEVDAADDRAARKRLLADPDALLRGPTVGRRSDLHRLVLPDGDRVAADREDILERDLHLREVHALDLAHLLEVVVEPCGRDASRCGWAALEHHIAVVERPGGNQRERHLEHRRRRQLHRLRADEHAVRRQTKAENPALAGFSV